MTMKSFTPHTEGFAQMFCNANEDERSMLGEMHLHWETEIKRLVDQGNEPQNIAHSLNLKIDESVAETLKSKNGRNVQCSRGCAHCCKLHVSITHQEAVLLVIAAAEKRFAIDWDKVERQSKHRLATWGDQSPGERRCVFLNDRNECGVYEHRPAACRKYMVTSDPKNCNTVKHPGAPVSICAPIAGETIVSAMLGVLDWGTMARMLLAVRQTVEGESS